jgi:TRAP-type C4-dicarboxylate transport system substrate-binding protein
MKMKRFASMVILFAAVAFLASGVEAKTWKISHVRPQGTAVDTDLTWFSETLAKVTDGKIKTKLYPASALGDYTVVQERVGMGAIDMACQPPASAADKRFQMVYFPYMVKNWEQAKKNFAPGAPVRDVVAQLYAEQGIHLLAAWPVYFGGISLNREPVSPGDPDAAKGIKLRVPPMKTFQLLADTTGYMGTPIPFSDAFTAVQTGVVDGVIGSGAEGYYSSFRDVTKYYIPSNTHFEVWYLIINKETFDSLEPELKNSWRMLPLSSNPVAGSPPKATRPPMKSDWRNMVPRSSTSVTRRSRPSRRKSEPRSGPPFWRMSAPSGVRAF